MDADELVDDQNVGVTIACMRSHAHDKAHDEQGNKSGYRFGFHWAHDFFLFFGLFFFSGCTPSFSGLYLDGSNAGLAIGTTASVRIRN